jgi:ABC-type multidrug transport system fused ATPase/permease subunit
MLIILLILIEKKDSLLAALPTIAIYIFAAYRIIPAVQQIYGAITQMRYSASSLDKLYSEFIISTKRKSEVSDNPKILFLNKKIKLKNVYFSYPNSSSYNLKNINIEIKARSKVAFVGVSGSGKTTTIDLILGLLRVSKGHIEVDGKIIKENNIRAWQKNIGYVPQNIYLADDTIASNIAFGVDIDKIDYQAVERAAKIASIHNFIANDLKKKYQTIVGERGIRLSGGQRQRIGIARAFYYKPQVIILDEATSSLDDITEQAVMNSIYSLDHESTIILVAHRLRTIKGCDQIFLLNGGEIKAKGNYKELMLSNKTFKKMLEV